MVANANAAKPLPVALPHLLAAFLDDATRLGVDVVLWDHRTIGAAHGVFAWAVARGLTVETRDMVEGFTVSAVHPNGDGGNEITVYARSVP